MAGWRGRVRAAWDAFVAFDDRLHERMQGSRTLTKFVFLYVCLCAAAFTVLVWTIATPARVHAEAAGGVLLLVAATALLCRWRLRQQLRDHRRKSGCCLACGYDLRESPERCPECGRPADDDRDDDDDDAEGRGDGWGQVLRS